jgi:hypothetical protein
MWLFDIRMTNAYFYNSFFGLTNLSEQLSYSIMSMSSSPTAAGAEVAAGAAPPPFCC